MISKEITIWERYKKDNKENWYWEHNHICDGFDPNLTIPKGINKDQINNWKNATWKATEAVMNDKNELFVNGKQV